MCPLYWGVERDCQLFVIHLGVRHLRLLLLPLYVLSVSIFGVNGAVPRAEFFCILIKNCGGNNSFCFLENILEMPHVRLMI